MRQGIEYPVLQGLARIDVEDFLSRPISPAVKDQCRPPYPLNFVTIT
jgi:hypothetical protein